MNVDIDNLRVTIYDLQNDIASEIRNLNSGGCIHFALYMKKALDANNIPNKVVLCDKYSSAFTSKVKNLDSFSHIMIYIKGIGHIDGYRIIPKRKNVKAMFSNVKVTNKVNLAAICDLDIWNTDYNRENNHRLEQLVNDYIWL